MDNPQTHFFLVRRSFNLWLSTGHLRSAHNPLILSFVLKPNLICKDSGDCPGQNRLVGSLKSKVSFAKESYKRDLYSAFPLMADPLPTSGGARWSKETQCHLPRGGSYLLCSLIKNREKEDPPWRTTPKIDQFWRWFLRGGPLPPGSWSGNSVNRKPFRGGGFLSIKVGKNCHCPQCLRAGLYPQIKTVGKNRLFLHIVTMSEGWPVSSGYQVQTLPSKLKVSFAKEPNKRDLFSAKEIYNFQEPTNRSDQVPTLKVSSLPRTSVLDDMNQALASVEGIYPCIRPRHMSKVSIRSYLTITQWYRLTF